MIAKTMHPFVIRAIATNAEQSQAIPSRIAPRSPSRRVVGSVKKAWATAWRMPNAAKVRPTIQTSQPNRSSPLMIHSDPGIWPIRLTRK